VGFSVALVLEAFVTAIYDTVNVIWPLFETCSLFLYTVIKRHKRISSREGILILKPAAAELKYVISGDKLNYSLK